MWWWGLVRCWLEFIGNNNNGGYNGWLELIINDNGHDWT